MADLQAGYIARDVLKGKTDEFFTDARLEVNAARRKFPSANLTMVALVEKVGELAQALLKNRAGQMSREMVQREAIQVAAIACRVATEKDDSFSVEKVNKE